MEIGRFGGEAKEKVWELFEEHYVDDLIEINVQLLCDAWTIRVWDNKIAPLLSADFKYEQFNVHTSSDTLEERMRNEFFRPFAVKCVQERWKKYKDEIKVAWMEQDISTRTLDNGPTEAQEFASKALAFGV
jgi:hypothetical protein